MRRRALASLTVVVNARARWISFKITRLHSLARSRLVGRAIHIHVGRGVIAKTLVLFTYTTPGVYVYTCAKPLYIYIDHNIVCVSRVVIGETQRGGHCIVIASSHRGLHTVVVRDVDVPCIRMS